jgi:ubiquinone/menaquinone biosynthesis C-methylase UbiE
MGKACECNYYDDPEFDYQDYWLGRDYEDQAERQVLHQFYQLIGQQKLLVDIGGGFGRLVDEYQAWVDKAIIVEPSAKILKLAKEKTRQWKNLSLIQGTAENLCLQPKTVDIVQMIRVAHHCQDLEVVFNNVYQVLKSPGWFILEYPNKINGLMTLRNWLSGNWKFRQDLSSIDRREKCHQSKAVIPFMNHHPLQIEQWLKQAGFSVVKCYSVSNLRRCKFLPLNWGLVLDKLFWNWGKKIWWGPSIFILAKKKEARK